MCGKKEEDDPQGECSQSIHDDHQTNILHGYQDQLFLQQLQHQQQFNNEIDYGGGGGGESGGGLVFPSHHDIGGTPILPWSFPQVHSFNPIQFSTLNPIRDDNNNPFNHHQLVPPPPPPPLPAVSSYGAAALFNRRPTSSSHHLQFAYDNHHQGQSSSSDHHNHHHLRIISDHQLGHHQPSSSHPFSNLQAEMGKMTAQEIMDAKALAASKSHSEAERRRRERINNHLAKLRSLLPSTTKTDKASLLAEVIQHVKELKRQTSQIAEASPVPTENDELTVDASDEDGKFIIKASLCCEDRSDLLPDLIKTLKALRLRTLKAEITTLGGRVKNVLFITGDNDENDIQESNNISSSSSASDQQQQQQYSLNSIQEALKAVMERTTGDESSSGSIKRQRTTTSSTTINTTNMNIIEHRSL